MLAVLAVFISSSISQQQQQQQQSFGNGINVDKIQTISKPLASNINPYLVKIDNPSKQKERRPSVLIPIYSNEHSNV